MGQQWKGKQYHLLNKNCNNFADKFCRALCGRGIPDWINRGATIMSYFPYVVQFIPTEYLSPNALKKQVKADKAKPTSPASKIANTADKKVSTIENCKTFQSRASQYVVTDNTVVDENGKPVEMSPEQLEKLKLFINGQTNSQEGGSGDVEDEEEDVNQ